MYKKNLKRNTFFYKLYLNIYFLKHKFLSPKKTYSQFGEDLIIEKYFKNFIGKYVDIGCYHPIKYNNTLLLYKKGWSGTNIDLNPTSIDLFNLFRKKDRNIVACLSDKEKKVNMYFDNNFSSLNSLKKKNIINFKIKSYTKAKIKTKIFSNLIKDNFDFLNIDCEGNDYKILKSINLKIFKPRLICIEIDKNDKEKIYKYLNLNGYKLLKQKNVSHIFKKN